MLAAFSLFAIWLDPTAPSAHADIAYTLLTIYLGWSLALAAWTWQAVASGERIGIYVHILDILAFTLFTFFTDGVTSPFFLYFVFAVIAGALRWQRRGALWTGAAALTIFLGMGLYVHYRLQEAGIDVERFIIRGVYLGVVAVLIAKLTVHEERLRNEMSGLTSWPRGVPRDFEALVSRELGYVAAIFRAPRVLMLWEEAEEPWVYLASHSRGTFRLDREPPGTFQPWVAEALTDAHFICSDAHAAAPTVVRTFSRGLRRWQGVPLHPELQRHVGARSLLSLHLSAANLSGRIFVPDPAGVTTDSLTLCEVVARMVQNNLQAFCAEQRLREGAATEERVRVARNLHDGLLQSLAAIALQVESAHRLLKSNPAEADERLLDVQDLLLTEQRDLRAFVHELKPAAVLPEDLGGQLCTQIEALGARVSRQWGVHVDLALGGANASLPGKLAHEVYRLVQAALFNAAQHAHASRVLVRLSTEDGEVRIAVQDDGRGFPFRGRFTLADLFVMREGPESIKQRVKALHGDLLLDSSESGSRIDVALPLGPAPTTDLAERTDVHVQPGKIPA